MTLGRFLQNQKEIKNVKSKDIAKAMGVSKAYLSYIMHEKRYPPLSEQELKAVSNFLELTKEEEIELYDLAGEARGEVPVDVSEYLVKQPKVVSRLRLIKDLGLEDSFWDRVDKLLDKEMIFAKALER